jgi:hypothetical protein
MDPYKSGVLEKIWKPFHDKRIITSQVVAVLRGKIDNRELRLIKEKSRALIKGEIHELILTDEMNARPGDTVNNIAYVSFVEINAGGVLLSGDELVCERGVIGKVIGFDETHMPNHLNIVLSDKKMKDGTELGLSVDDQMNFRMNGDEI